MLGALLKQAHKAGNRGLKPLPQHHRELLAQLLLRQLDHRLPLQRVIGGQGLLDQGQIRIDLAAHQFLQLTDPELTGVADIDRAGVLTVHQPDYALDQIIHIAETAYPVWLPSP